MHINIGRDSSLSWFPFLSWVLFFIRWIYEMRRRKYESKEHKYGHKIKGVIWFLFIRLCFLAIKN